MSHARRSMTHRCSIERDATYGTSTNDWGNDPVSDWEAHLDDVPCRFWYEDTKTVLDGDKSAEVEKRKLIVPAGTDVTEDDRVVAIVDRLGNPLADGPMRIDSVGVRQGHMVLTMVRVS